MFIDCDIFKYVLLNNTINHLQLQIKLLQASPNMLFQNSPLSMNDMVFCIIPQRFYDLKTKIFFRIVIANAFDNFFKLYIIFGVFTLFYPFTEKITEYSSEIFMPCIRNKTS